MISAGDDVDTYEERHVHEVYDAIATHFSLTRHKMWPRVSGFISALPAGSLIGDIGCGNGKYMVTSSDSELRHTFVGVDRCVSFCALARRHGDSVAGDARRIPLRAGVFDAVLNIACVHHIATRERRVAAWADSVRLLRKGGLALCFVWAKERPEPIYEPRKAKKMLTRTFAEPDMLVPWHLREKKPGAAKETVLGETIAVYRRYYHIYNQGELEDELSDVPNSRVVQSYFAHQNWCAIVEKL